MIIGADVGTQSLKVAVLDDRLRTVGRAARSYQPSYPKPGRGEQAASLWNEARGPAIAEALQAARVRPTDIRAIGFCGQLDGCIAVDAEGNALAPCLSWMDRGAAAGVEAGAERRAGGEIEGVPPQRVRAECGLVLDPGHLGAKARWLLRHLSQKPIA